MSGQAWDTAAQTTTAVMAVIAIWTSVRITASDRQRADARDERAQVKAETRAVAQLQMRMLLELVDLVHGVYQNDGRAAFMARSRLAVVPDEMATLLRMRLGVELTPNAGGTAYNVWKRHRGVGLSRERVDSEVVILELTDNLAMVAREAA